MFNRWSLRQMVLVIVCVLVFGSAALLPMALGQAAVKPVRATEQAEPAGGVLLPMAGAVLAPADETPPASVWQVVDAVALVFLQVAVPPLLAFGLSQLKRWIDERREERWMVTLGGIVRDAVAAAEQLGLSGQLEQFARDKLRYAVEYVQQAAAAHGIPLDVARYMDVIRGMIEAEVRRQFGAAEEPASEVV